MHQRQTQNVKQLPEILISRKADALYGAEIGRAET